MARKKKRPSKLFAFDFFCGAGGLTRGLRNAGIKVLAGFDFDLKCKNTFEKNNRGSKFVHSDIRKLTVHDLRKYAKKAGLRSMLFAGCAPCQPFTQQIKNGKSRHASTLLGELGRLIAAAQPRRVLMENVPGIARVKGNSTFRRFLRLLKDNGYKFAFDVLDAKRFGVPQTRRRLVLLAVRGRRASLPSPLFGPGLSPYRTVRHAISHFKRVPHGKADKKVANHVAAKLTKVNLDRLRKTPRNGGDRRSWPAHLKLECHSGEYKGHTDVYGRMFWDAPAPTLTGRCNSISNGRYGHPRQNRAITLREAAALQSFSDDYTFWGANKHIALQIGNAVPVKLAEMLGKHLKSLA